MEVRWCTISDPEQQKCSDMSKAFREAGIQPSLLCVQGTSANHCIQLITAQEADAITLDGGAIYEAGKEHGLKPVVGEVYDQGRRVQWEDRGRPALEVSPPGCPCWSRPDPAALSWSSALSTQQSWSPSQMNALRAP
ncbi:hypothetical protein P7K49_030212 [Saguinus oedipus]|uniref:Transferrin-like domain-containing protein n=1 Tax=Saguinus oedipus TaxID=9490 RepID=A0ABQ9U1J6_SAGOE|nr:hypothetical protein P7K49_030212 [Saguinus oedipus]